MSIERARTNLPIAGAGLCRLLRTKTAFGTMQPGGPDWRTGESTSAVYWCLRTMETFGNDGRLAHPHACLEGRACFASEQRDSDSDDDSV